jgi:DeoR/GlpR family transcriptional regulator of sugar metabolism
MKRATSVNRARSRSDEMAAETSTFFKARDHERRAAKDAVAKCIVDEYLKEGDSILLDAGSSLYPIAEMIAQRARMDPGRTHFTIMTHNYKAFEVLVKVPREANLNIVLAGGRYDQDLNALFGNQTVNAYADFFPRIVLLGMSAFKTEIGLFCHGNTEELAVKRAIFEKQARDRIIVADYTKIGQVDGFRYGESSGLLSGVNRCILVTDQPVSDADTDLKNRFNQQIHTLKAQGVEVNALQTPESVGS